MPSRITCLLILFLSPPGYAGDTGEAEETGLALFRENCMACHLQTGLGIREMNAPSIAGLPRWYISDQLRKFRWDERGFDKEDPAGNLMRANALALPERAIPFLGKFVESLPPNPARNTLDIGITDTAKSLYARNCAQCHGERAEGNHRNRVPPLTSQPDWYLLKQMANFRTGKRIHGEAVPKDLSAEAIRATIGWLSRLPDPQSE